MEHLFISCPCFPPCRLHFSKTSSMWWLSAAPGWYSTPLVSQRLKNISFSIALMKNPRLCNCARSSDLGFDGPGPCCMPILELAGEHGGMNCVKHMDWVLLLEGDQTWNKKPGSGLQYWWWRHKEIKYINCLELDGNFFSWFFYFFLSLYLIIW